MTKQSLIHMPLFTQWNFVEDGRIHKLLDHYTVDTLQAHPYGEIDQSVHQIDQVACKVVGEYVGDYGTETMLSSINDVVCAFFFGVEAVQ